MKSKEKTEEACFGAGCFWGVQSEFDNTSGVIETSVGFMGGNVKLNTKNAYRLVWSGTTGHAEVVHIKFNSKLISYKQLLNKFFSLHDPTQINRQGPDVGSQYKSVIFFYNKTQELEAKESVKEHQKLFSKPIATQVVKASKFYKAEEHHQKYLEKRGLSSCHI